MVLYMKNGVAVAAGFVEHHRTTLHGHTIPPGFVCTLLTVAQANQPAPLVLGDQTENSYLEKGKFFALPETSLMNAMQTNNEAIQLRPYCRKQ